MPRSFGSRDIALKAVIKAACRNSKLSVSAIAANIGLSDSSIYKFGDKECHENFMSVHEVEDFTTATDHTLIQHLCERCGGTFVPNGGTQSRSGDDLRHAALITSKEHGEFVGAVLEALKDGKITCDELSAILRQKLEYETASGKVLEIATDLSKSSPPSPPSLLCEEGAGGGVPRQVSNPEGKK